MEADGIMTRLLFVRHGETEHNVRGQICTHTDGVLLSELGVQQAADLAVRLSGVSLSAVYSSPMLRAIQTATPIAKTHGLSIRTCEALRELSAGELDGRSDEEGYAILNAALDAWCAGDDAVRIGVGGDIGVDVIHRLAVAVAKVADHHRDETVLLMSHGGLLQMGIPWLCSNLTPSYGHRRHIANSSVIEVEATSGDTLEAICVAWGDDVLTSTFAPIVVH
ncbi:MAG: histidine phosphatase family protein [Actinomycetota bacterium]